MLLLILGITWCSTSVSGLIPQWDVFYQHTNIFNACTYGNLTVEVVGKTYYEKDCNSSIPSNVLEQIPRLKINSNNETERFTVLMLDLGPQGQGPEFIEWMVTNVSINSLPNYQTLKPSEIVFPYMKPMFLYGAQPRKLIRFLVLRHQTPLRVAFSELWTSGRQFFSISKLFSNTRPNLQLCGPVAGSQFWLYEDPHAPSAPPMPPLYPPHPVQPVYVPVVPVQPAYVPAHLGYTAQPQPGYGAPGQPSHPIVQPPHKKSAASISQPMQIIFFPLVVLTVMYL